MHVGLHSPKCLAPHLTSWGSYHPTCATWVVLRQCLLPLTNDPLILVLYPWMWLYSRWYLVCDNT